MRLYGFTAQSRTAPTVEGIPGSKLSDPFNSTYPLTLPLGKSLGRYQNLGDSAQWDIQDFRTSASNRINFTVQRQLPGAFVIDATWFINRSANLPFYKALNMADPNLSYTYKDALDRSVANPFYNYLNRALISRIALASNFALRSYVISPFTSCSTSVICV